MAETTREHTNDEGWTKNGQQQEPRLSQDAKVCRCGHSAGSHSSLRFNCLATTDGTHATRCDCRQYAAARVPPAICGACGHLHATTEQDGTFWVFHRCRMRGCRCNAFSATDSPAGASVPAVDRSRSTPHTPTDA